MQRKITSIYLPDSKIVYRLGAGIVNASGTISSIVLEGQTDEQPLVFGVYDQDDQIMARIITNQATITYAN